MSVTIVNLKTTGYQASTEEMEKYKVYSRVSFNINPHAKFDAYGSVGVEFFREYTRDTHAMLGKLGFKGVDFEKFEAKAKTGGACLTVTRGEESLYLHPTQISGIIENKSLKEVKEVLAGSALFDLWEGTSHDMVDMPTTDAIDLVRRNKDSIATALLNIAATTRVNKFMRMADCLNNVASYYSYNKCLKITGENGLLSALYVNDSHREVISAVFNEVGSVVNELVESGKLVKVDHNGVAYIRALNKTELKKWAAEQRSIGMFEERKSA